MIIEVLVRLIELMMFFVFARAIISWFPIDRNGPVVRALDAVTEPILEPLRRVVPTVGMIDITPMVAMLILLFLHEALINGAAG